MRTWTPPLLFLAISAMTAFKPREMLKLFGGVLLGALLVSASMTLAGWLMWQALLYLINHAK
jgi:hypothetical protein